MRRPVARALERARSPVDFPALVRAYAHRTGIDPEARDTITELLTDCRHWCDAKGHDFAAADRRAVRGLYLSEVQGPATRPSWYQREQRKMEMEKRHA